MAGRRIGPAGLISGGVIALVLTVNAIGSGLSSDPGERPGAPQDELVSASHLSAEAARLSRSAVRPSDGCKNASANVRGGTTRLYIESGGRVRSYLLSIPSTYRPDRSSALILSFHGRNRSSRVSEKTTGLSRLPAIVAYPDGAINRSGKSDWQGAPMAARDVDDIAFTNAVIDRVEETLCVDRDRIYTVGHSDGGGFAVTAACELRQRIAGVVAASAAFYDKIAACQSPISILDFHATHDRIVPYAGMSWRGADLAPISTLISAQAEVNQCDRGPRRTSIRGRAVDYRWSQCASGRSVEHIRVSSRFHRVPTTRDLGGASFTWIVWRFLQKHTLQPVDLSVRPTTRTVRS